jgi:hypothetical protein
MKKVILLFAAALITVAEINAQGFKKGDCATNLGISISNTNPLFFGGSIEFGLLSDDVVTLGLGMEFGYAFKPKYPMSQLNLGIRAPIHYSPVKNLDLYTAPTLTHAIAIVNDYSAIATEFGWVIIGIRCFFNSGLVNLHRY